MTDLVQTIVGTFLFQDTDIRVFGTCNAPLFVANDIFNMLNVDIKMIRSVPLEWRFKNKILSKGGLQQTNLVSESGLYWIVMRSNKPEAIPFQIWICEEVLPSIRKTGQYKLDEERQKILTELKQTTESLIQFQKLYTKAMEQNEDLHDANKRQVKMNTELHHDLIYARNPERDEPDPVDRTEEKRVMREFRKLRLN